MARDLEQVAKEYIEEGWAHCPRCKSDQIEGHDFDFEGNFVYQNVTCNACGLEWTDQYLLSFIDIDGRFVNSDDTLKEVGNG